jgi:hypothetical protein
MRLMHSVQRKREEHTALGRHVPVTSDITKEIDINEEIH